MLEQDLYHIPLRHCWFEELPEWLTESLEKLLIIAACGNHFNLFQNVLARFQPCFDAVDNTDHHQLAMYCFIRACEKGCEDIFLTLSHLDGVDPSEYDNEAFKTACLAGQISIIRNLWKYESVRLVDGQQLLGRVVRKDNVNMNVVKFLVEECQVNPAYYQGSCLRSATERGSLKAVKYLVTFEQVREYLDLAVVAAAEYGQLEVLKFLVQQDEGMDPTTKQHGALFGAAKRGDEDLVKLLLDFYRAHSVKVDNEIHGPNGDSGQLDILEIINLLLETNELSNVDFDILRDPVACGHKDAMDYLSSIGIDLVNGNSDD
ncbi:hypothetical protein HDU76_008941 [Blyttiomyces sp. JEL0837]|nr:hypothetical protein HDU76_008941 [Blyttiomyces sp. JEL0837]